MPAYEYRHLVTFQETSLIGNAYFSHFLLWQGHCREHFLRDHAPCSVQRIVQRELAFFTRRCSCEYIGEWGFSALDEVLLRMTLDRFRGGRMTLAFEYLDEHTRKLMARGFQEVHCKVLIGNEFVAAPFPSELVEALVHFADSDELRFALREALEFQRERAH
jgi:enediyne biosynthesis thioesterase